MTSPTTTTMIQPTTAATSGTPAPKPITKGAVDTSTTLNLKLKYLRRISQHPSLTPYRRRVYRALLSIPPGRWTTYSALATYLDSSARAVGNAMRTNPFAPEVPCHRVLAADRTLGGYKGEWRRGSKESADGKSKKSIIPESKRERQKRSLLEEEGVRFDPGGKALGECFSEFEITTAH
ncbi:hypothetical protein ASPZODRAFT_165528 [Penicilliopsis zonata CBS 506.65]|uniref:Methylated-DNA--protein-cysteine methyltransferase n=1 Tax=Penicilliopsis zonata CBS 506.65 TaxID=1073090 RepID=A0A1L9SNR2_9EURO|nr:hypothetical protein ASPZODRAFT_165528 [Penicilliopsis zonata CBS 506.65]OJJ48694.1 hypothetical protein ASPZODRAFT_165528 [Penicilliopsis zonata CBS 506.65]